MTRARAAARTDRDAAGLRPFDEVGHDQEVARKLHPGDDIHLEREALPIVLLGEAWSQRVCGEPRSQAFFGLALQLGGLSSELIGLRGAFARRNEARQDRLAAQRTERASLGDFDGILKRFRQITEQLRHLLGALEVVVRRYAPPVVLDDIAALCDAQQHIVSLVIVGAGEISLVGGDYGKIQTIGQIEQLRLDHRLLLEAVALQLHVESISANFESVLSLASATGFCPARRAVSIGPSGPPVSTIRSSAEARSWSIVM